MTRVIFADSALRDIEDIWCFLSLASDHAAERVVESVVSRCERIADAPRQGRARDDLFPVVRAVAHMRFVILYTVRDGKVHVMRVVHGARDLDALLPT